MRIEQCAVLKDHGDALANSAHALFAELGDLLALHLNRAGIRLEEAHQHAQRNRLADAAAAEDAQRLAAVDGKADVLEHGAAVEGDRDIVEDDDRLRRICGGAAEQAEARSRSVAAERIRARLRYRHRKAAPGWDRFVVVGQRHAFSLRDACADECLGAVKILRGIQVEKPANGRQTVRVRNLAGLSEQLDSNAARWAGPGGCRGSLECGKAAPPSGMQVRFGARAGCDRSRTDGKGLAESIDRRNRDGEAGDSRVMKQIHDERGRQQGQIDGQKDGVARGAGSECGADAGQRTEARLRNPRRLARMRRARQSHGWIGACDRSRKASLAEN